MHLVFYALLLPLAVLAAPVFVLTRGYFGWRFGLVLLAAWLVALATMPGGIEAVQRVADPAAKWAGIEVEIDWQAWPRLGWPQGLTHPRLHHWLFLIGLAVWPLQLLLMLIGAFNDLPAGYIGIGLSPVRLIQLTVASAVVTVGLLLFLKEQHYGWAVAPVVPALAAIGLLMTMGGRHGRMLILDRGGVVRKAPTALERMTVLNPSSVAAQGTRGGATAATNADPLHNVSAVQPGERTASPGSGGLAAVFGQRPEGLARLAESDGK